jgi:hypothetical protein
VQWPSHVTTEDRKKKQMQKKRGEREKSVRENNKGLTTEEERGNYHSTRQRELLFIEREQASEKEGTFP